MEVGSGVEFFKRYFERFFLGISAGNIHVVISDYKFYYIESFQKACYLRRMVWRGIYFFYGVILQYIRQALVGSFRLAGRILGRDKSNGAWFDIHRLEFSLDERSCEVSFTLGWGKIAYPVTAGAGSAVSRALNGYKV